MKARWKKFPLTVVAMLAVFALPVTLTLAQGNGNGNGNGNGTGGGGSGGDGPSFVIARLDDADGAFRHGQINDVNNLREVVGSVSNASVDGAAYWTVSDDNGAIQSELTLLDGGYQATAINDLGEIVGLTRDAAGNHVAVYWQAPTATAIVLPPLPGNAVSCPFAISNNGVICGYVGIDEQNWDATSRAVAWRVTVDGEIPVISPPVELPAPVGARSSAIDLNDNDTDGVTRIVGNYRETWTAVQWEVVSQPDGSLTVSPTPQLLSGGEALALGISNDGVICGRTNTDAIVWTAGTDVVLDRPRGRNKVPRAWARDISDSGLIVGEAGVIYDPRACLWNGVDGSLTYLDDFLDNHSPLQGLNRANAVNAAGDIVGDGWSGGYIAVTQ